MMKAIFLFSYQNNLNSILNCTLQMLKNEKIFEVAGQPQDEGLSHRAQTLCLLIFPLILQSICRCQSHFLGEETKLENPTIFKGNWVLVLDPSLTT